jgi:hypothetical protein
MKTKLSTNPNTNSAIPDVSHPENDGEVLIIVEGGNVQAVYSEAGINLRVRILDHDNLKEIYDRDHRERITNEAIGDLLENFTEEVR